MKNQKLVKRKGNNRQGTYAVPPRPVSYTAPRRVLMRYMHTATLSSNPGVIASVNFNANSVYDPYQTGVGHQPLGYDQLSLIYSRYTVNRVRISVQLASESAYPGAVAMGFTSGTPVNDLERLSEQPLAKWALIPASGGPVMSTTMAVDMAKFFGVEDISDVSSLSASVGSNPVRICYFNLQYQSADTSTTTLAVARLMFEFDVTWSAPLELPTS